METIKCNEIRVTQTPESDDLRKKDPILVLHPAGQTPASMKPQLRKVAEHGPITAPNIFDVIDILRKNGQSINYDTITDTLLDRGIIPRDRPLRIFAFSMGGGIGFTLTASGEVEVIDITAASPVGYPQEKSAAQWMLEYPLMQARAMSRRFDHRPKNNGTLQFYTELITRPKTAFALIKLAAQADLRHKLSAVNVPVELLWGSTDHFISVKKAPLMRDLLAQSHLHLVSEFDHSWFNIDHEIMANFFINGCNER